MKELFLDAGEELTAMFGRLAGNVALSAYSAFRMLVASEARLRRAPGYRQDGGIGVERCHARLAEW